MSGTASRVWWMLALLAALAGVTAGRAAAQTPCEPAWRSWGGGPLGVDNSVFATTIWDPDGTGPLPAQLVAGGQFTIASGATVNRIARWDGSQWAPFGIGMNGTINALTTWDPDGAGPQPAQLVAGGEFTIAGGVTVNRIARWDGTQWLPFGTGMFASSSATVDALTTWDPDGAGPLPAQLVAGGLFTFAGGVTVNHISRWDGTQWLPFGTGMGGSSSPRVESLTTWDPDGSGPLPAQLVAGGDFTIAGGVRVNRIARWDGTQWRPLGMGKNDRVEAMTTWDPDGAGPLTAQLVAGGRFGSAIARWDGTQWLPFGTGMSGGSLSPSVSALTTWDPDGAGPLPAQLVAGGIFATAGGVTANYIARWDGTQWLPFGTGMEGGSVSGVYALTTWDPDGAGPLPAQLVAGGSFGSFGSQQASCIARWDGTQWLPFMSGISSWVENLTTWDPDGAGPQLAQLVAGGAFTTAGSMRTNRIARWDGSQWRPFGSGMNDTVLALSTLDPDGPGPQPAQLVAGGNFTAAGGVSVNHIARWDGAQWRPFGTGISGPIAALLPWDPDGAGPQSAQLVAGGSFTTAGGVTVNSIARWDGSQWLPFGTGMNSSVFALTTWDPDGAGPLPAQLVAGGEFTTAGGVTVNCIARWDGTQWAPFGVGMSGRVNALTTWDPDGPGPLPAQLVAGGVFETAGAVPVHSIARWDGSQWLPFGPGMIGGAPPGFWPFVDALTTWDPDGAGPLPAQLVAGGFFDTAGGVPANFIARWDGSEWAPFGSGMSSLSRWETRVRTLTTWDPDGGGPLTAQLVAGGRFTSAGGVLARFLAWWGCPLPGGGGSVPAADLRASAVAFSPSNVEWGQTISASATVLNSGPETASAGFLAGAYLSRDDALDIGDLLIGTAESSVPLAVGASRAFSIDATVPRTIGPGRWRVIAAAWPAGEVDPDSSNNASTAAGDLTVTTPVLVPGGPAVGFTLAPGESMVVPLRAPGVLAVLTTVTSDLASGSLDMDVARDPGFGPESILASTLPRAATGFDLPVPSDGAGEVFVRLTARLTNTAVATGQVRASVQPFLLTAVDRSTLVAGASGSLAIDGLAIPPDVVLTLWPLSGGGEPISAAQVVRSSSVRAVATFSPLDEQAGTYQLIGTASGASPAALPQHITITPRPPTGNGGGLRVRASAPRFVRFFSNYTLSIDFRNDALFDIIPPVLIVRGPDGFERRQVVRGRSGNVQVMLPGEGGSKSWGWRAGGDPRTKRYDIFLLQAEGPFDWAQFEAINRPAGVPIEDWREAVTNARALVGETWADVAAFARSLSGDPRLDADGLRGALTYAVAIGGYQTPQGPGLRFGPDSCGEPGVHDTQVCVLGGNPATARRVVVMAHGWCGPNRQTPACGPNTNREMRQAIAEALASDPDVAVVTVDWDSRSPIVAPMSPFAVGRRTGGVAAEAKRQLDALGVADPSRMTFVGHSFGTIVGNKLSDLYGNRIGRLVALNPPSELSGQTYGGQTARESFAFRASVFSDQSSPERASVKNFRRSFAARSAYDIYLQNDGCNWRQCMHGRGPRLIQQWLAGGPEQRALAMRLLLGQDVPELAQPQREDWDAQVDAGGTPQEFGTANPEPLLAIPAGTEQLIDSTSVEVSGAIDPNDIIGPAGFGPERWITPDSELLYTIRFENLPTATAPAAEVFITSTLPDTIDPASIEFVSYGVGERTFSVPLPGPVFERRDDLRAERGLFMDTRLAFDPATRRLAVDLRAIDPVSLTVPLDPRLGIVPPNTQPPAGEGFVVFRARALPGVSTGQTAAVQARIIFDQNDPIDTNIWVNGFDRSPPVTRLGQVAPVQVGEFDLPWTLEDPSGGAPATGLMLYRSVGSGPFEPLGLQPLTPAVIRVPQPPPLVRQRYLVRGIDGAGNYEPPRDAGDIREIRNIDVSGDRAIDFNDILAFLNLFNAEDPLADLTENGVVDFNDFLEFLNLYTGV